MPGLTIYLNEDTKKQHLFWASLRLAAWSVLLIFYFFLAEEDMLKGIVFVVLAASLISNSVSAIRSCKKSFYITINDTVIEWFGKLPGESVRVVAWNEIYWIKQEQDGSITFYQESSFSQNLRLKDFREEDKSRILKLLEEIATQKQIRLVNF